LAVRRLLRDRRTFAAVLVLVVLVAVVIGTLRNDDDDDSDATPDAAPSIEVSPGETPTESESPESGAAGPAFPTAVAPSRPESDAASGLPVVTLAELPPEAAETVELIEAGGPFPYADDGETFLNSAGLLPQREPGYYQVYTVDSPGSVEPTSRRIVTGTDGELYWTDDLYTSFRRIQE
jgi:ribonuclease T1